MSTRRRFFRRSAVAVAATLLAALRWRQAVAFPVFDSLGVGQLAKQAIEVTNQLTSMRQQVETLRSAARQLDPRSYRSVQNLLSGNEVNFQALLRDVQSMGYAMDRIDARYRQLFPDEKAIANKPPQELEAVSKEMNRELHESALVAARAQTSLRTIEDNNAEARNILGRSEGNGSQVAQLQSALQMLGLIHQNLVSITQVISSAGRVTSNQTVRAVTERRIERERGERMLKDYSKPSNIPAIDGRFLQGGTW